MSCRAARLSLITVIIICQPFLADLSMMILTAAAAWVSLYLSTIHEKRIVTRALCEAKTALIAAVSKSRER
jgi:hypothetical protein